MVEHLFYFRIAFDNFIHRSQSLFELLIKHREENEIGREGEKVEQVGHIDDDQNER